MTKYFMQVLYLKDADLAARYQVSRATIWRWAADKKNDMPKPIKIGHSTRWVKADIERWEDSKK